MVIFCFSCPACDEQVSNYRTRGVHLQLHWDETVLVRTGSTAAEMEKSSKTYTLQINLQINKQTDSDFD